MGSEHYDWTHKVHFFAVESATVENPRTGI